MIFSKTICPICQANLIREEAYEDTTVLSVFDIYRCKKMETVQNWLAEPKMLHHYIFRDKVKPLVTMIIPPFGLEHSQNESLLCIVSPTHLPKFIKSFPLMDMDYSNPDSILRLQTLTTFS